MNTDTMEAAGPRYCKRCGKWPALNAGLCDTCDDIRHCKANPVPYPSDPKMLRDLLAAQRAGER